MFKTKPGTHVEITDEVQNGKLWFDSTEEVILLREQNKLTASFFKSGIVLSVRINRIWGDYYMDFEIKVPTTFYGKTRGLLGILDGNKTNDLHVRRQPFLPLPFFSDRDLFEPLMSCK